MIEKVVPLSKVLSAAIVIAFQDLDIPLGLRILKGEDTEVLGSRNVLLYLY